MQILCETQEKAGLNAALVQSLGSLHATLYRQQKNLREAKK